MLRMSQHAPAQTDRGINVHDRSGRGDWMPAGWQQGSKVVPAGHARESFENVGEVCLRVVTVAVPAPPLGSTSLPACPPADAVLSDSCND